MVTLTAVRPPARFGAIKKSKEIKLYILEKNQV